MRKAIGRAFAMALVCAAAAAAQAQNETARHQGRHSAVDYPSSLAPYARSFVKITDAAWEAYRDAYGLALAEPIRIHLSLQPDKGRGHAQLWTDGSQDMNLVIGSEAMLKAPATSGLHNVYGMCHEMGHMAIYRRMRTVSGMPDGIGEGWAHYFGCEITSHIYGVLGPEVYPEAHNYGESSGMPRLLAQFEQCEKAGKWEPDTRAAKILYDVERTYGRETLSEALNKALDTRPSGAELVKAFSDALVAVTKDPQAVKLVPPEFLVTKIRMETANADIARKPLYRGLKAAWQQGLLRLSYGDGTKEGERSISGSGHAVTFCRPEGKWALAGVEFFGCRYGSDAPPADEFSVFLCDEKFRTLREVRAPYSRFATAGKWKWERVGFDPIEAPAYFYVVLCFEPTASKGVFMAEDTHVSRTHSRMAYPSTYVMDVRGKSDWMIRCLLKPADEATKQNAKDLVAKLLTDVAKDK